MVFIFNEALFEQLLNVVGMAIIVFNMMSIYNRKGTDCSI